MFHGLAAGRKVGLFISPRGFASWDDSPIITPDDLALIDDGMFDLPSEFGARLLSLTGRAVADSEAELGHWRSRFNTLAYGVHRYTVAHQGETLWADGRAQSTLQFRDTGYRNGFAYAEILLPVKFADFRKYGSSERFTGTSVDVYHRGNFPADPVVEVTGTLPGGYKVVGAGREFVVGQALAAGQTHVLDFRSHRVYRNGSYQRGAATSPRTWTIPPGNVVPMQLVPVSGSGSMTVRVADTYI